jgi:hypothetical protein
MTVKTNLFRKGRVSSRSNSFGSSDRNIGRAPDRCSGGLGADRRVIGILFERDIVRTFA